LISTAALQLSAFSIPDKAPQIKAFLTPLVKMISPAGLIKIMAVLVNEAQSDTHMYY